MQTNFDRMNNITIKTAVIEVQWRRTLQQVIKMRNVLVYVKTLRINQGTPYLHTHKESTRNYTFTTDAATQH